jgi:cell fate regulator YaaT (PSP1 superfamily)
MTINDQVSETISEEENTHEAPEVIEESMPEVTENSESQIIEESESESKSDSDITQNTETTQEEQDESDKARWQDGDEIDLVRVRFPGNSKSFPFLVGKRHFSYGQKVVAMSDRGMDVGYINSFPYTVKFKKTMLPIRSISKVATNDDILAMQGDIDKQRAAEVVAADLIDNLGLDMQITHVEIIQFGKKMVFYFTAPARVDFRDLVKKLVGELKMRIELRQISVRDRAAALGSIGACGLATCCSTFLKNYGNVSIKMAKNQNLALIPSKINGVCGQIKCCIKYEDDVYSDKRKLLPREGNFIHAANGDKGKVTKLHILVEQFDMITEKGQIRRYAKSQFHEGKVLGREYKFPVSFSHVVNETSNVIGLEEVQAEMAEDFNKGLSEEEISLRNVEKLSTPTEEAVSTAPVTDDSSREESSESENKESVEKKNPRRRNRNRNRNKNRNKTPAS